jgi:hypothetical protein
LPRTRWQVVASTNRPTQLVERLGGAMHGLGLLTWLVRDDPTGLAHAGRVLEPGTAMLAEG